MLSYFFRSCLNVLLSHTMWGWGSNSTILMHIQDQKGEDTNWETGEGECGIGDLNLSPLPRDCLKVLVAATGLARVLSHLIDLWVHGV